jgi:pimeloyl-ACP methyl ester carboxylesterase
MQQAEGSGAENAIDPPALWVSVRGTGSPTVVFEAGGGEDSSVWADLEPAVRRANQVRTMVYDRAGLGRSAPTEAPYRIDDEANALRRELDRHGISAPVVLVAHSYGGFVATLVAATDPRVAGVVLVDATLAAFFDDAQLDRIRDRYTPQFPTLRQAAPQLARVMIPVMQAYPATAARVRQVDIPAAIPTIDIVAENTWVDTPEEISAHRQVHRDFAAASPAREAVFADGSGHHVMRDRPDLVLDAVARVISNVRDAAGD